MRRACIACAAGLFLSVSAYAADASPALGGLAQALARAWSLSPQAAAGEARQAEALANREVASGLTPEPLSVSIGSRNDRLARDVGKQEYEVEVAAPLWLPGQRNAREAEAESRLDETSARLAALRLDLAAEVREAWWALAAARNADILSARRLDTARALASDVRRRYEVGDLSRIDANLAQVEVHVATAESIDAQGALQQAEQVLHKLTGVLAPAVLDEEAAVSPRSPNTSPTESEIHPALAAAAAAARSARAKVKVASESRRAAPELALRVLRERNDSNEPYGNTLGIRLKIPLSSGSLARREIAAAQAEADQAEAEVLRVETRVQLEMQRARGTLAASEQQLAMARGRLALATENLRLAEKAFSLGETELATLLRIRAAALDAEGFLARQQLARAAAISRLNQSLGVLP